MRGAAGAHGDRRLDELALAQAQHLAAHDAGQVRPAEEAHDQDQVQDPRRVALRDAEIRESLRQHARQGEDDQQEREGEDEVHQPADERVEDATGVAGDDPDRPCR